MGMDLSVYRLVCPAPLERDEVNTDSKQRELLVSESQALFLEGLFPGFERKRQEFINVEYLRKRAGAPAEANLYLWDFSGPSGWASFSMEGRPDILYEGPSEGIIEFGSFFEANFQVEELGYIRKPFRREDKSSTFCKETGTLTLFTNNFGGADLQALRDIFGEERWDNAWALFTQPEKTAVEALGRHCFSASHWKKVVTAHLDDPRVVVCIDW